MEFKERPPIELCLTLSDLAAAGLLEWWQGVRVVYSGDEYIYDDDYYENDNDDEYVLVIYWDKP